MQHEAVDFPNSEPSKGLPPVTPPSGKHIVQLFVVPGLIAAGVLVFMLVVHWLFGGTPTPEQLLRRLGDSNVEVRWRAASDLAQVLPRDRELAADPKFALDLTDVLRKALPAADAKAAEYRRADAAPLAGAGKGPNQWEELPDEEKFIQFLIASLGDCTLPVGVPLLSDIATREGGADPELVAGRRVSALLALMKQGESLTHLDRTFDALPAPRREAALAVLDQEAHSATSLDRREAALKTLNYLNARPAKSALGVDLVLARCAEANNSLVRKYTALALNFWDGTPAENDRMEATLQRLATREDGRGAPAGEEKVRRLEIQYKAAEVLARRGSPRATGAVLDLLADMLDEKQQSENFRTKLDGGRDAPDEPLVYATVRGALRGLAELHQKKPDLDLSRFDGPVRQVMEHSDQGALRKEAAATWAVLHPQ